MRFLHTADWQIGMRAAHVGAAASRVREERLASARRVMDLAKRERAEFVLLAGDTFEDNGVDRVLVQSIAEILASFDGAVFVTAGNHDPLVPGSVWDHPAWRAAPNVRVVRDEAPIEIAGGVLYPCVAREKQCGRDPTRWIDAKSARGVRVGIAHGTVEGVRQDEPDYPVPREAASRAGLDYLALGHWHSTALYPDASGAMRMAYSGTHETTKFGERDSGNVLLVDIAEQGAAPVVTSLRSGGLCWHAIEGALRAPGDLARLREAIESVSEPERALVRVQLSGLLAADEQDALIALGERIASRFLHGRMENVGLRPSPTDAGWLESLPPGVVREAASRLRALADPGYAGERPAGASADVAALALLELYDALDEEPAA